MFSIPASSNTERTAPPAIIPVPSEAGLNITAPAPDFPVIGWGIVVLKIGTVTTFFLPSAIAFWIAMITSEALAQPIPTWPFWLPTITIALKLNFLPPLTTFVTRLIWTTLSVHSDWGFSSVVSIFCFLPRPLLPLEGFSSAASTAGASALTSDAVSVTFNSSLFSIDFTFLLIVFSN